VALAPFFERVYGAVGGHLAVSRDSLVSVLDNVSVGIHCDSDLENDLWIAEMSANIIARLYPKIAISGPSKTVERLESLVRAINPQIEIIDDAPAETTIALGLAAMPRAIAASANGWVATVSGKPVTAQGPPNPYSATIGAGLACAKLFRRVFLRREDEADVAVSLLNYDSASGFDLELPQRDLGSVWFVGVGAVGNSALWALGKDQTLSGNMTLLDPEELTLLNLQRYVLGMHSDVGRSKVDLAQAYLTGTSLKTSAHRTSLEAFADSGNVSDSAVIAISVDNVESRRVAQALLPRLAINGWTGEQGLGASWHEFSRNAACLACLYHPHREGTSATEQAARALGLSVERATILWISRQPVTEDDIRLAAEALGTTENELAPWVGRPLGDLYTDVVCGAVPIDLKGLGRVETVPLAHQSVLAGGFMAAELVKRTDDKLTAMSNGDPLVSYDNVLERPPKLWAKPRPREMGCICGDRDYQEVYRSKWVSRAST
jgi:hypothetical protein